jgi:pyruvate/2-oxoglutarate dehydrogenase complex dihydrolipoamide dehydrogenase (E3) component
VIGHDPSHTYRAVVIGAGSGGLTLAIGLGMLGREVVLVEGDRVGGDCTNLGCIPSKVLLHATRSGDHDALARARHRRDELARLEHDEMAEHPRIRLVHGWARLTARRSARRPHVVDVATPDGGTVEVRARDVVVCAGSRPATVEVPGLPGDLVVTNEELFELERPPRRMVVVGGGPIGVEMATAFERLGTEVHVVEAADRLLPSEDPSIGEVVEAAASERGVHVHVGTTVVAAGSGDGTGDVRVVDLQLADGTTIDGVDRVLVAAGRRPRLDDLGLDDAGVAVDERGIVVDAWGRTSVEGVWAVGDVTGRTLTTHGANAVGRRVVRAIAFPRLPRRAASRAMPAAVFGDPEVASVGLPLAEVERLRPAGRRRYVVELADLDRGFTDDLRHGRLVVDVERFTGRILRAAVVGPAAAELIGIFTLAIDHGIGMRKLFGMVHPYPAHAEAIGRVADAFARDTYPGLPREWSAMARSRLRRRR